MSYILQKQCISLFALHRKLLINVVHCSNKNHAIDKITIGDVSKTIFKPKHPHLVPIGYLPKELSQNLIQHLQWIMKKDVLGQDIFLIGLPGPSRGRLIFQYLEMTQREVEYVVLSRDTTENDLKQRREIKDGTAFYKDQSAVRAAIEGRFLIIDGIEKAERNVLPVLNNLLENREMQLEDGRFLVSPERYDKLLSVHSKEVLDNWKLVRVSENFRVVALGLPVPYFKGNPLDPPFRSRFQARLIQPILEEQILDLKSYAPKVEEENLRNLLSACHTLLTSESITLGIPKFPIENLHCTVKLLNELPYLPLECIFQWMYPIKLVLPKDGQKSVLEILKNFKIYPHKVATKFSVQENKNDESFTRTLEFNIKGKTFKHNALGHNTSQSALSDNYVSNAYHNSILADMLQTHLVHDFCLVGNKGSGKTTLVKKFASMLNYNTEMVMLYKDMTSRDLLQHRITDESGNTLWRPSQLVQAAQQGKLLVLDGLHQLHSSTLAVLHSLIHNRELQLFDGTRLIRNDRYDAIKDKYGLTNEDMRDKKIFRIHPALRIIALAEEPTIGSLKNQWLTPELMSLFLFHPVRPLSLEEEKLVIERLIGKVNKNMEKVLKFAEVLRNSEDEALKSLGASFSTRQLIRIAQRLYSFENENVHELITQACLGQFLPQLTKEAMEKVLESCGITKIEVEALKKECYIKDGKLHIGKTVGPVYTPSSSVVKVPEILFYDNKEHINVMEDMLQDFLLGEHLLLVGNQGVGKNKIADRFLQLLNRPREYIQLHRDTTVQSLTQQPNVVEGKIIYEDSPLVKAVQFGHVLVVDEADKAPTHVTSILKALVESGEMVLSDGRCIVHSTDPRSPKDSSVVVMHPDFRMIVLANRPGFPFLGNNFFATLGDIFSCHAVDNPSLESEIEMLRQYGPMVPEQHLVKLVKFFGDLRSMSDKGLISYPYSTREVVNIVKHLNSFPDEGISRVIKNVFDFDAFSIEFKETLNDLLMKHGMPMLAQPANVKLAKQYDLPKPCLKSQWNYLSEISLDTEVQKLRLVDSHKVQVKQEKLDAVQARSNTFTEQQNYWQLPLNKNDIPLDITTTQESTSYDDDMIHVATANPVSLFSLNPNKDLLLNINLSSHFPAVRGGFRPNISIAALHNFVFLHESNTNQSFVIQPMNGVISKVSLSSTFVEAVTKISRAIYAVNPEEREFNLCSDLACKNKLLLYNCNGKIILLDFDDEKIYYTESKQNIKYISGLGDMLLVIGETSINFVNITNPLKWNLRTFDNKDNIDYSKAKHVNLESSLNEMLHNDSGMQNIMMSNAHEYASIALESANAESYKIFSFPRETSHSAGLKHSCILPQNLQIVQFVTFDHVPHDARNNSERFDVGYLEVVDVKKLTYSYVPIAIPDNMSSYANWLANTSNDYLLMHTTSNENIITVDSNGCIRRWETNTQLLQKSFLEWRKMVGENNQKQLTVEHENPNQATAPKHGKVDPTGSPHVGGNTWAGGTGGRDTAGLGGKGGPYRLDAGHPVYQLSDAEKASVPPEVQKAAREMAMRVYKQKLKEIQMSEYDADMYNTFYSAVKKQIQILRVIIDGLQARSKERQWLRHQTSGEFDDGKLIEGITGEKSIYKKRAEQEPEMGSPQEKPKRLKLVVDISGSMYRFNGHDDRLQRELESVVLLMEAFEGYKDKFLYEIVGHSGDEVCLELSTFDKPPQNNKDRLDILKSMYVHSQFCMSGDNTLSATEHAIKTITKDEADEYFVIVLSDANFDRYGIRPQHFGKLLTLDPKVNAFAIFIGSLGDQAQVLSKHMPAGRGFLCFDTADLAQILQKIFTSALLRD